MEKDIISYDDFAKLEIRIGEILQVEIVENADKLLKLIVDFGETNEDAPQHRQIISGIRGYFEDPQVLIGRKSPFLVNLEPRVIRGFESQGMILAASHDGVFGLLEPHQDLPAGAKIS